MTDIWFHQWMLRVPWSKHVTNEKVLRKIGIKRTFIITIKKETVKIYGTHNEKSKPRKFNTHKDKMEVREAEVSNE